MTQFCVYRLGGGRLVLDLQSEFVDTATRTVAPLVAVSDDPDAYSRLEPTLRLEGEPFVLKLSEIAAISVFQLPSTPTYDLSEERDRVMDALNFLFWRN